MARVAIKRATQGFVAFTVRAHTAAAVVGHGDYAIDIGEIIELTGEGEMLGDGFGHGRRAVDGGEYAHVIAGADFAVNAFVTLKGSALIDRHKFGGFGFFAEAVIFFPVAHGAVVHMHMLACRYVLAGKPNGLAVFKNGFALADSADGYLMHGGDVAAQGDILFYKQHTSGQRYLADSDVITVMQHNNAIHADFSLDDWAV